MSGYYKYREIKIIEETYVDGDESRVRYELRAYYDDGSFTTLEYFDDLADLFPMLR